MNNGRPHLTNCCSNIATSIGVTLNYLIEITCQTERTEPKSKRWRGDFKYGRTDTDIGVGSTNTLITGHY